MLPLPRDAETARSTRGFACTRPVASIPNTTVARHPNRAARRRASHLLAGVQGRENFCTAHRGALDRGAGDVPCGRVAGPRGGLPERTRGRDGTGGQVARRRWHAGCRARTTQRFDQRIAAGRRPPAGASPEPPRAKRSLGGRRVCGGCVPAGMNPSGTASWPGVRLAVRMGRVCMKRFPDPELWRAGGTTTDAESRPRSFRSCTFTCCRRCAVA